MRYLLLLLLAPVVLPAQQPAQQPWNDPFGGSPQAILKAASTVSTSADDEAIILLDERHYEIQKDGRLTLTVRKVFRLVAQDAVDDWSTVAEEWQPWHQAKPAIRARVITADGVDHVLDPKTIADAPAFEWEPNIFSDSRVVRAPLPALAKGAVVEYQITTEDTAPLFAAGITQEIQINTGIPTERFHLWLDAARGVTLKAAADLIPAAAINRSESKRGIRIEVDFGPVKKRDDFEPNSPRNQPDSPSFRFSTGQSWQEIAGAYNVIVDARIKGSDLRSLLNEAGLPNPSLPPLQVAAKLTAVLHKHVRYTGVEFGEAAIVPNPPADVLARNYGDCKDKAALLVALLRAAGLDARLALLQVGVSTDIDPSLPGFGQFNHAIVYVPLKEPLWIDATADTARVGTLPVPDQGRHALIIGAQDPAIIDSPVSSANDNRISHRIEVLLTNQGKADIEEALEAAGSWEGSLRAEFTGDENAVKKSLEAYVKRAYQAESLGAFSVPNRADFSQPFQMKVEAKKSAAGITQLEGAIVRLSDSFVFEGIPYALAAEVRSDKDNKPRHHDFVFDEAYHAEVVFIVRPPPGFTVKKLPDAKVFEAGGAHYASKAQKQPDGSVEIRYSFDTGKPRYTPEEFAVLRAEMKKHSQGPEQTVEFTDPAADLLLLGKTKKAIELVRADVAAHPKDPLVHLRYAQLLMNVGAGEGAIAEARSSVDLDPKSAQSWAALGYACERDSFGRLRTGHWNRSEAEKALQKAVELDAANLEPQMELAILAEHDDRGVRYSKFAPLDTAVERYRDILKKGINPVISQNLAILLLHMGRLQEGQAEIEKLSGQPFYAALATECTALISGADSAILQSQNDLTPAARGQLLSQAGWDLLQMRHYSEGIALLQAGQRVNPNPQAAAISQLYGRVKPVDDSLEKEDSPKLPVQRFLALIADGHAGEAQFRAVLAEDSDWKTWQPRIENLRSKLAFFDQVIRNNNGNVALLPDIVVSWTKLSVEGEGKPAYRITATADSLPGLGVTFYYVIQTSNGFRILAMGDGLDSVGARALKLIKAGDLNGARQWLDFLNGNALPEKDRDDRGPAFRYLWAGVAPETRGVTFARAAAASLLGTYAGSEDAVSTLRGIAANPPQYMDRADLQFAICEALQKAERWTEFFESSRLLLNSPEAAVRPATPTKSENSRIIMALPNENAGPYAEVAMRLVGKAAIHTGQWDGLEKMVTARLKVRPKDHAALQYAAMLAMHKGDFMAAGKWIEQASVAGYAQPIPDALLREWNQILANSVNGEDANDGNQATQFSGTEEELATRALIHLRAGKEDEFRRAFALVLARSDCKQSDDLPWLVEAELLKHYGLDDQAAQLRARLREAKNFGELDWAALLLESQAIPANSSTAALAK